MYSGVLFRGCSRTVMRSSTLNINECMLESQSQLQAFLVSLRGSCETVELFID